MEEKMFNDKLINKTKLFINKITTDDMEKKFVRARIISHFENFFNLNNAKGNVFLFLLHKIITYIFFKIIDEIKLAKEMAKKRKMSEREKLLKEIAEKQKKLENVMKSEENENKNFNENFDDGNDDIFCSQTLNDSIKSFEGSQNSSQIENLASSNSSDCRKINISDEFNITPSDIVYDTDVLKITYE